MDSSLPPGGTYVAHGLLQLDESSRRRASDGLLAITLMLHLAQCQELAEAGLATHSADVYYVLCLLAGFSSITHALALRLVPDLLESLSVAHSHWFTCRKA